MSYVSVEMESKLAPWEDNPRALITWWDMENLQQMNIG
jgi:hypothetical protein